MKTMLGSFSDIEFIKTILGIFSDIEFMETTIEEIPWRWIHENNVGKDSLTLDSWK